MLMQGAISCETRRISTYVAVTCPVESAAPSREAEIQRGEDERNPPKADRWGFSDSLLVPIILLINKLPAGLAMGCVSVVVTEAAARTDDLFL